MPDTNINQIKQAEKEAEKIVEKAQKKVGQNIGSIREQLKNTVSLAEEKTRPVKQRIEKETDKVIKEYEKLADQEQEIALEKLEDIDNGKFKKAADLVINQLTQ